MYGTIFNLKVKQGHEEVLLNLFKESDRPMPKGMIAWFLMNPDEERDWVGAAIFESKEAHISNANDPEQSAIFAKLMEHLDGEPTWIDGTYVIAEIA
ncbi:MAG TPA: hypothetical protein DEZ08_03255 [Dehalococcoidia bacterium]|jgi:hypothetical protein|nr:hypothetical protein [Dehalococcoidia bacterium]|tara:strand:- start:634 stop:924 length:291 start_codon:yes stop_codon:yes gene_type:complete